MATAMVIFLLWRRTQEQGWDPERVAANLRSTFAPLFKMLPKATIRQTPVASLVILELPVQGWKPPFFEEDTERWALAPNYPVNARAILAANGTHCQDDGLLLTLGRQLREDPAPLLRDISPPFSLIWASKRTGEVFAQNDGLGRSQLFEYQSRQKWALTNRIVSFRALGVPLEPVPEDWAVRWTLGWFPMNLTGYRAIRFLDPATELRISSQRVSRTQHDVLSKWIGSGHLPREDCLEMARCSLLKQLKAAQPQMSEDPEVGLSGGRDTRAVASSLRALGMEFRARVTNRTGNPDLMVAKDLARIANLPLEVRGNPRPPPAHIDQCRRAIHLALLWQGGYRPAHKHKTFLANANSLDGGGVSIEGHHGEIGRAFYLKKIGFTESRAAGQDERFVERLTKKIPPFTRRLVKNRVREIIEEACRQADSFGLTGTARLEFFYLYERTRRERQGAISSQPGIILVPFLNPEFIRAVFACPEDQEKLNDPFHKHIVGVNAPDWSDVPYDTDVQKGNAAFAYDVNEMTDSGSGVSPTWMTPANRREYDNQRYWNDVAKPLIDGCLERGDLWSEIFDPDLVKERWAEKPDELVIMHLLPDVLQGHRSQ
ncbi:MAG: hypothetical protein MJD61_03795 [Proteobacteria bacterium]|nr:hypothetical protein [Pseudomonadota bacterium]